MHIVIDTQTLYKCDNKLYTLSGRKLLRINDIFIDLRDYQFKVIESVDDIVDMSFVAPELYIILDETKESI